MLRECCVSRDLTLKEFGYFFNPSVSKEYYQQAVLKCCEGVRRIGGM